MVTNEFLRKPINSVPAHGSTVASDAKQSSTKYLLCFLAVGSHLLLAIPAKVEREKSRLPMSVVC